MKRCMNCKMDVPMSATSCTSCGKTCFTWDDNMSHYVKRDPFFEQQRGKPSRNRKQVVLKVLP